MQPAARIGDMHFCPRSNPGGSPHGGGPVFSPGAQTVLINNLPAAVKGTACSCSGPPDMISMGSTTVLIGGSPAARMGDITAHGGLIIQGSSDVLIG